MKPKSKETPLFWLPRENAALSASAGSGKTYNLTWRLIAIMLYEQNLGNSLKNTFAVTFTNKATLDMKYKVLERLKKLAYPLKEKPDEADEEAIEYLAQMLTNGNRDLLLNKANKAYKNLLNNLSDLNISTIHSFLSGIVSLFPFEIGINPDNDIIDEAERENLLKESFAILLEKASGDKELEDLILHTFNALGYDSLDVKERIYELIINFFEREWDIKELYKSDSLNKELLEIRRRKEIHYAQFNGKKFKDALEEIIEIIDTHDGTFNTRVTTFKENIKNLIGNITHKKLLENKKYFDKNSIDEISGFKKYTKHLVEISKKLLIRLNNAFLQAKEVYEDNIVPFIELTNKEIVCNFLILFLRYLEIYEERKRYIGALDFSDLEGLAYGLFSGTKFDRDYFYFRIDTRIKHLLIDEFQDTSIIQWDILSPLVDEIVSGVGVHDDKGSFFYVGDKKQAIYRFRRGESGLFDLVKNRHKIEEYSLKTNFRSAKNIVDTVNTVFSKIMTHTKYERQKVSVESEGYVEIAKAENNEDNAQRVVDTIKMLSEKGVIFSDIALLVRTYTHTDLIENLLKKEKIPYRSEKTSSLREAVPIKDIINLLKFINNSEDDISLSSILKSPLFRIDNFTLHKIKFHKGKTLYLKVKNSELCKENVKTLEGLLKNVAFLSPLKLLNLIYSKFNIYSIYSHIAGAAENLRKFFEEVFIFQKNNSADISTFLDYFEMKSKTILQAEPDDKGKGGVKIMSVHKAKGLEFHSVIIPFADFSMNLHPRQTKFIFSYNDNFKLCNITKTPVKTDKELSESLRKCFDDELEKVSEDEINLLYVALTRARENLFVIGNEKSFNSENSGISKLYSALDKTSEDADEATIYQKGEITPSGKPDGKKTKRKGASSGKEFNFSEYFNKDEEIEEDISPSTIEEVTDEGKITFSSQAQIKRKIAGETIHYALSRIELLNDYDNISEIVSDACAFAERNIYSKEEIDKTYIDELLTDIKDKTVKLLSDNTLKDIFYAGDMRQILTEKQVYYKKNERKNVSGIVDRIVIDKDRVRVIDYKWTKDITTQSDIEKIKKRYRSQLAYYSHAMSKLYPGKSIETYLLLISAPEGKRLVKT